MQNRQKRLPTASYGQTGSRNMAVVMVANSSLKSFHGTPMQYIVLKTIDLALENYFRFRTNRKY